MSPGDVQEMEQLARDIDTVLAAIGGAEEVRELEVQEFRYRLDGDDEGAARVLARVSALAAHHEAASELLSALGLALARRNLPLAYAVRAGVSELVQRALASEALAGEVFEEGADTP